MNYLIDEKLINEIEKTIGENINSVKKINVGYSRNVYCLNEKYILKICATESKEKYTINEINYLASNNFEYIPSVILSDYSKSKFPYIYHLEEKMEGNLLMGKWKYFNEFEKENILNQIIKKIESIHSSQLLDYDCMQLLVDEYEKYLNIIIEKNILNEEKILYLKELKNIIFSLFAGAKTGIIHGDLHFNNILINDKEEVKFIDFEKVKLSFLEREYDPINRMIRNPNSLINNNKQEIENVKDFEGIINYIHKKSSEVSSALFLDRLLMFDCINSMMWLPKYPEYDLYIDILFDKSKKLLK